MVEVKENVHISPFFLYKNPIRKCRTKAISAMFFILSKILFYFLMPATWIAGSLLMAYLSRKPAGKQKWIGLAGILFFFFGNAFLSNEVFRIWEVPATPYAQVSPHEVGIVLTGMTEGNKEIKDRLFFSGAVDRILNALDLYKQGKIRYILITGATPDKFGLTDPEEPSETHKLKDFLVQAGVPQEAILLETQARNTRENASYSAAIVKERFPTASCLLITSAFHMRRSLGCFEKAGLKVTPFSTDIEAHKREYALKNTLLPTEVGFYQWSKLIHEWLGYLVYKLMAYA
jgi:uncharacterized SAM-binding protein YcdF (DUF218 family)